MTAVLHAWWTWIALASVQVAIIVPLIVVLERWLGSRLRPTLRGALWTIVMLRLVTPPALGSIVPAGVVERLPATGNVVAAAPPFPLTLVLALWLAGAIFSLALVVRRYRCDRAFCNGGSDATPGIDAQAEAAAAVLKLRRTPRIVIHEAIAVPATFGIRDPIVVLPRAVATSSSAQDLEHVLLHELAHIRRRDALRTAVSIAIGIVYWFHPLVGVARRRLAGLREIACDRAVLRVVASPEEYRRTLIRLAHPLVQAPADLVAGAAFFAHRSELLVRLELLSSPQALVRAGRGGALGLCAAAFAAMVIADASIVPRTSADEAVELEGCLRLRYAVYAALAEEAAQKGL